MANILVFGAGFVAEPLVEYLMRRDDNRITVASQFQADADRIAGRFSGVTATTAEVTEVASISPLIEGHDLVVSLVPATLHQAIAETCVRLGKHLVTASYESPAMVALDAKAREQGVILLNEIGLDPGIDHLGAMDIIDRVQAEGGRIRSFVSWCGGLPAPDANDNPLGYKFAWAPRGVLMALQNEAVFLRDNKEVHLSPVELLESAEPVTVDELELEGYANRNSLGYQQSYDIPEARTILRGTLRYRGFCDILQAARKLGLLDLESDKVAPSDTPSWNDLMQALHGYRIHDEARKQLGITDAAFSALKWLGCFSDIASAPAPGPLDRFCELLKTRLAYQPGERDMVVLQHQFGIEPASGESYHLEASLVAYGEPDGYSAMAKTVGYPAAMAVQLICDGVIEERGVVLPFSKGIYQPLLELLAGEGIAFTESRSQ